MVLKTESQQLLGKNNCHIQTTTQSETIPTQDKQFLRGWEMALDGWTWTIKIQ